MCVAKRTEQSGRETPGHRHVFLPQVHMEDNSAAAINKDKQLASGRRDAVNGNLIPDYLFLLWHIV